MPKKAPARPGNHITGNTETLVVRIPKAIKNALRDEAAGAGVDVAELVREDLARGLTRRGWELLPETAEACGV
jgi:hypothetical protein